jgi:phosphoenolpyruvate carboxylase
LKVLKKEKTPTEIVDGFFDKYKSNCKEEDRISFLFKFIQYIERQVVLFDAIEDAAFPVINNMDGIGTMRNIKEEANSKRLKRRFATVLGRFQSAFGIDCTPDTVLSRNGLDHFNGLAKCHQVGRLVFDQEVAFTIGEDHLFLLIKNQHLTTRQSV